LQIRERCALSLSTVVFLGFGSTQVQGVVARLCQTQQQLLAITDVGPLPLGIVE
jgi:hypothetical protein